MDFGQDDRQIINIKSPEAIANFAVSKDEGTTVTCSTSGCNKTIEVDNNDKDIISDVVVHVKTSVNVPKSKNETIEDTPDVPVILGYGNSNPQFIPGNPIDSNPVVVSNYPVPIPESKIRPYPPSRKYFPPNRKQVSFENDVLYLPYLEPSFHKYYFGEQPPLQYVWSPRAGASFNPVEFKRFEKPTWNRVQWHNEPVGPLSSQRATTGHTTCTCQNPGLNWYPTTPTWNIQKRNLNTRIDDKLAPLN